MIIDFNKLYYNNEIENFCAHNKSIKETREYHWYKTKVVCSSCNYCVLLSGGSITYVQTTIDSSGIWIYKYFTAIRSETNHIDLSYRIIDNIDLETFYDRAKKLLLLL